MNRERFKCPGEAERFIREARPSEERFPEADITQHEVRQFVVMNRGLVCGTDDCTYEDITDSCGTTVCARDQGQPALGGSVLCRFAGDCDFEAATNVLGTETRVVVCDARQK